MLKAGAATCATRRRCQRPSIPARAFPVSERFWLGRERSFAVFRGVSAATRRHMRMRRQKIPAIFFGHRFRSALMVANHVGSFARCQQFVLGLTENLITESQRAPVVAGHSSANYEFVVESRWAFVAAGCFGDDDQRVVLD